MLYGAQDGFDALDFLAYRDVAEDFEAGAGNRASQVGIVNGVGKLGFAFGEAARIEAVPTYCEDGGEPLRAERSGRRDGGGRL